MGKVKELRPPKDEGSYKWDEVREAWAKYTELFSENVRQC